MSRANHRMAEAAMPTGLTNEYVAPALRVLGHVRELTESHHHHHDNHHHHWDGPNGLHPPGFPPPLFNGSA